MKLSEAQRARVRRLLGSNSTSFVDLALAAELDPGTAFREADLRRINFGADNLAGFDFTGADLRGANLSHARGLDPALLEGARTDDATRGFIIRDFPGGPEMVLIPPGTFLMGGPEEESKREKAGGWDDRARPVHRVTITRPFLLGRYPITRGQFAAFVRETDSPLTKWREPQFEQDDNHPVVNINHDDAMAYIEWASAHCAKGYRLPSEAEWEYAARAGTVTARYWGDGRQDAWRYANAADESLRRANNDKPDPDRYFPGDDGYAHTSPVGSFLPNVFGLYDMLGNAWEWCADDWHDSYDGAPTDGAPWTALDGEGHRSLRGGSWDNNPGDVRAARRVWDDAGLRDASSGFRVARTLKSI